MRGTGKKNQWQKGKDLARVQRAFALWRSQRKFGARIPEHLWASAVKLVAVHGLSRTASELSLSYYSLQERVDKQAANSGHTSGARNGATFVEWTTPPLPQECVIEFESATGSKMRVSLKGQQAVDLLALSDSFFQW